MKLTFRKCEVKDLTELEALVAEHAETLEPGMQVIASNLNLGRSSVTLAGLDATRRPVLIAVGLTADDTMIFRMVEAYAWCLEYPDSIQRLVPGGEDPGDWPPRVAFVAERLLDSFLRKIRLLKFPRVDCFEYRYVEVNGTAGFYLDPVDWTRELGAPPPPMTSSVRRTPARPTQLPPAASPEVHRPAPVGGQVPPASPGVLEWDELLGERTNTAPRAEDDGDASPAAAGDLETLPAPAPRSAADTLPAPSGIDLDSTPTWRKFLDKLTGGFDTRPAATPEEQARVESPAAASVVAEVETLRAVTAEPDTTAWTTTPASPARSERDPLASDDAPDKQHLLLEGLKLPSSGELAPQWRKFLDRPGALDESKTGIVREYLRREFPMSMLYEFHEFQRDAQVFELQDNHGKVMQLVTITAEFLEHHPEAELRGWIERHRLAQALRQAGQAGVLVTRAGLQVDHR